MRDNLTPDEKWKITKQRLLLHDEMLIEAFKEIRRLQDMVEAHDDIIRTAQRENRI